MYCTAVVINTGKLFILAVTNITAMNYYLWIIVTSTDIDIGTKVITQLCATIVIYCKCAIKWRTIVYKQWLLLWLHKLYCMYNK